MEPILKWQYDQMVKELLLLQDHENEDCPCESGGEMCKRKHLMTIEAYAQETLAMESNPELKENLQKLSADSKEQRIYEEQALCGIHGHNDLSAWARNWRKKFEGQSLSCDLHELENFDYLST